jgi:NodT family efflux transporter outer membrane factor (OMF) lipoprotein
MIRALTACAVALTLAACTRIPTDLPSRPALRAPASAAALATLAGESSRTGTAALSERWWESFGLADLNRLVDIALKDRPDLAAAQSRLTLASQAERLARLQTEVNYATDAGMVREHLSKNGLFPPPMGGSTLTQTDVSQTLSYNLDWWGRNRALVHAAGNETRAVQAEAAAVRLTVAAAVADAYFAWADTQARLGLINELTTRHRREYTLLKARFDLGLDAAQPVIEAQQQLDLDEDQMRALEYLDRSSRYRLAALIGADPDHAGELPSPRLDGRLADLPAALPLDWLSRRPDVTALRARVEAAADLSLSARADFYPNIDLRLMVGLETLDIGKLLHAGSLTGSLGPAVHLPLFNTATLTARLNQREAEYAAAVAAYNRVVLDGAGEAADAYALEGSLAQRAQAQARATREARNTFDLARHRLELGFATPLETLAADAAVLERQQGENAIRAARLRARVQLFKALGGGLSISKE